MELYKNHRPRFGSLQWCIRVVNNPNLTKWDHERLATTLRETGNWQGLKHMQKLLRERLNKS